MKKIFLILILIFSGCSIKPTFNKDPLYEKTLKYTKRAQIVNSLETKALIDTIYLNPLYPKKFENPTFLIGVYNNFDNKLITNEFNITLNNKTPIEINSTIPSFIPYKNFPFYNSWMNYYLVKFPKTNKPYNLEYKSKHWGEVNFTF